MNPYVSDEEIEFIVENLAKRAKMLNVALVGFGYWGPNIARNINNNPNLNLHTICDMIDENLEKHTKYMHLQQQTMKRF